MTNSIRSESAQRGKEQLDMLIKEAGYTSFRQFCKDAGIDQSNLYSNFDGTYNISIKRMFIIANKLRVPIMRILEIFYPDEVKENVLNATNSY